MGIFSSTPFSATPANQGAEFSPLTMRNHPFGGGGVGGQNDELLFLQVVVIL